MTCPPGLTPLSNTRPTQPIKKHKPKDIKLNTVLSDYQGKLGEIIDNLDILKLKSVGWEDIRNYPSLKIAVAAITPDQRTLLVSTPVHLTKPTTVPSHISLWVLQGGSFSGAKLTVNGNFEAGLYQVFKGGIEVSFGAGSVKEVYPQWWGATGIVTDDATTAISKAISVVTASNGGIVYFSAGTYTMSDEITITGSFLGIRLIGEGWWCTNIIQSVDTKNIFNLTSLSGWSIEDLSLSGTASGAAYGLKLSAAIHGKIIGCWFANFGENAIYATGTASTSWNIVIDHCSFSDNHAGGAHIKSDSRTFSGLTIRDSNFQTEDWTDERYAIDVSGQVITIEGNIIEQIWGGVNLARGRGISICINYFEKINKYGVVYGSGGDIMGMSIKTNYFATRDLIASGTDILQTTNAVYALEIGGNYHADKDNDAKKMIINSAIHSGILNLGGTTNTSTHVTWGHNTRNFILTTGGLTLSTNIATLTGNLTIFHNDSTIQMLDPDGVDRTITFDTAIKGCSYIVYNSGATHDLILASHGNYKVQPGERIHLIYGTSWERVSASRYENFYPYADNTYYLGKNDDDDPFAWKGVILKDTTNGKYYRIEVINGVVTATDLSD